jgi:FkbM family methyltransferase
MAKNHLRSLRIRDAIKAPFRRLGFDLVARRPGDLDFMRSYGVRTVMDVGASDGAFAAAARRALPGAFIHSFEPLPGPRADLERLMRGDPRFRAWGVAAGDRAGRAEFMETSPSDVSSFLSFERASVRQHNPGAREVRRVDVPVTTLDEWAASVALEEPIMLKADVQGYEGHVIRGAESLLRRTAVAFLEVAFFRMYEGQPLFHDIQLMMHERGFSFQGLCWPVYDHRTGRQVEANAIYHREPVSGQ